MLNDLQVCVYSILHISRSQTYSASEVDIILAINEEGRKIEWVEIDPEAFTGIRDIHSRVWKTKFSLWLIWFPFFREWWVGHCASSSQEDDQQTLHPRWPGVSGDLVQSDHPEEAPVLHHQYHPAVFPHLFIGRTGLLLACTRSLAYKSLWLWSHTVDCYGFKWGKLT